MEQNNQNVEVQQGSFAQQAVSSFDGGVLGFFGTSLLASLAIVFSIGIATPWAVCYMWNYIIKHIQIDGRRLKFDGKGVQLFGNWIKWFLLTIITLGIYSFWVYPKMINWVAKHTHFE